MVMRERWVTPGRKNDENCHLCEIDPVGEFFVVTISDMKHNLLYNYNLNTKGADYTLKVLV